MKTLKPRIYEKIKKTPKRLLQTILYGPLTSVGQFTSMGPLGVFPSLWPFSICISFSIFSIFA